MRGRNDDEDATAENGHPQLKLCHLLTCGMTATAWKTDSGETSSIHQDKAQIKKLHVALPSRYPSEYISGALTHGILPLKARRCRDKFPWVPLGRLTLNLSARILVIHSMATLHKCMMNR